MEVTIGYVKTIYHEDDNIVLDKIAIVKDSYCPAIESKKTPIELEEEILDMMVGKDTGYHEDDRIPVAKNSYTAVPVKVIDVPDNVTNNDRVTCQDCKSTKIRKVVIHGNGSVLYFCGNHRR